MAGFKVSTEGAKPVASNSELPDSTPPRSSRRSPRTSMSFGVSDAPLGQLLSTGIRTPPVGAPVGRSCVLRSPPF